MIQSTPNLLSDTKNNSLNEHNLIILNELEIKVKEKLKGSEPMLIKKSIKRMKNILEKGFKNADNEKFTM